MVLLAAPRKVGLGRGAGKTDIKCLILGKQSFLRSCPRSAKGDRGAQVLTPTLKATGDTETVMTVILKQTGLRGGLR